MKLSFEAKFVSKFITRGSINVVSTLSAPTSNLPTVTVTSFIDPNANNVGGSVRTLRFQQRVEVITNTGLAGVPLRIVDATNNAQALEINVEASSITTVVWPAPASGAITTQQTSPTQSTTTKLSHFVYSLFPLMVACLLSL